MRLIDADTLVDYLNDFWLASSPMYPEDDRTASDTISDCIEIVESQPIFEIDDPLIARWVGNKCKVCGYPIATDTIKFCPNCGAKMDGKE